MRFFVGVHINSGYGYYGGGCFPPVQPVFYNQGYYGGFGRPSVFGAVNIHTGGPSFVQQGPELDLTEYRNLNKTINTADHFHPGMPRVKGDLAYAAMESLREALQATHGEKHKMDFLKEAWKSTDKLPEGEMRNNAIINIMDRLASGGPERHLNAYVQPNSQPSPSPVAANEPKDQPPTPEQSAKLQKPTIDAAVVEVLTSPHAQKAVHELLMSLRREGLSGQRAAEIDTNHNRSDGKLDVDTQAAIGAAAYNFKHHEITASEFGEKIDSALVVRNQNISQENAASR